MRLCVLSHRVCSALPTTNFEIEHANEMDAQKALRADFGAPKTPQEPISELRKLPETLPDNSQKHPGAQLRTRNSPNQAEVAPERAGPRFSRPPIDALGPHLASPPWPPIDFLARGHMRRPWRGVWGGASEGV